MPFQVGSVATHDDGQHIDSAKRNSVSGVAGLNAAGEALVSTSAPTTIATMKNVANGIAGLNAVRNINDANLLSGLTPTFSGYSTNPGTAANIVDELVQVLTTDGAIPGNAICNTTYDLGAAMRISLSVYSETTVVNQHLRIFFSLDDSTWYKRAGGTETFNVTLSALGNTRYVRIQLESGTAAAMAQTRFLVVAYRV